jgi:hypothetical protein
VSKSQLAETSFPHPLLASPVKGEETIGDRLHLPSLGGRGWGRGKEVSIAMRILIHLAANRTPRPGLDSHLIATKGLY